MTINIEITSTPDTALLSDIHTASFGKGWDVKALEDMLSIDHTIALVAALYEGFALLRLSGEEAEILTLAVNAPYRRQGIGKALVKAILALAETRGIKTIFLEVRLSNSAALALYGHYGFALLSHRKDYYHNADGSSEDAVIMRRQR